MEEVFVRVGPVMNLRVGGRSIGTTAEHPFYVRGRGWVATRELRPGDELSTHDGRWVAVESVCDTGEFKTVYNLRVAEHHTYFVGCQEWGFSVWAHNTGCGPEDWARMVEETGEPYAGRNPKLVKETRSPQDYGLSTVAENPQQLGWFQTVLAKLMGSTHPKGNAVQRYMRALENGEPITQDMLRDVAANLQLNMKRHMKSVGELNAGETIELHHWNYSKDAFPLQVADPRNLVLIKGTRQQNAAVHDVLHSETSMSVIPDVGPTAPQHRLALPGAAPGLDYLNTLIAAGRAK